MKTKYFQPFFLLIVICGCDISGYEHHLKDILYEPHLAIPIGSSTYSIRSLIEDVGDEELDAREGDDHLVSLIYRDTTVFNSSQDFIAVDDVVNNAIITPGVDVAPVTGPITIPFDQDIILKYTARNEEGIDYVITNSGDLELHAFSTFNATIRYTITIESSTNLITDQRVTIPGSLDVFGQDQQYQLMEDVRMDFTRSGLDNTFIVNIKGEILIQPGSQVFSTDNILFNLAFRNLSFRTMVGDFGEDEVLLQDGAIDFKFFKDFGDTGLEFNDPSIKFTLKNSYGIPMHAFLNRLATINNNGDSVFLRGPIAINPSLINGPGTEDIGGMEETINNLTRNNSNVKDLFAITPSSISLPIRAISNPLSIPSVKNFLTDASIVEIFTEIEIPLDLTMNGFTSDVDFDLSGNDIVDARELTLHVTTTNGIPFNGNVNFKFYDNDFSTIDPIYILSDQVVFSSPSIDSNGISIGFEEHTTDISLDLEGIKAFIAAEKLVAEIVIDTFEADQGRFVKLLADNELIIELGLSGDISVRINVN
ncbi:MAG: hypothetical protein O2887_05570 [Bacteroidetes bacterium]|nr:hypothetical protein [Bacteroidota bacterium]MDA1119950.1 hypothetical protein [Bacteroidota bacterium]